MIKTVMKVRRKIVCRLAEDADWCHVSYYFHGYDINNNHVGKI
ncbi:hypothetical protein [Photobacterium damselae]